MLVVYGTSFAGALQMLLPEWKTTLVSTRLASSGRRNDRASLELRFGQPSRWSQGVGSRNIFETVSIEDSVKGQVPDSLLEALDKISPHVKFGWFMGYTE